MIVSRINVLHIHDANMPSHHIPDVLCWIEIWRLWKSFECSELTLMLKREFLLCDVMEAHCGFNKQLFESVCSSSPEYVMKQ